MPDESLYIYQQETPDSYRVGTNSSQFCNAVGGNCSKCPEEIRFKGLVAVGSDVYPVTTVGFYAFNQCGEIGNTKRVVVPKEVRVIREYGIGNMDYAYSLEFEKGSQLEEIHPCGLDGFGYSLNNTIFHQTLVLPSTLKKINKDSIFLCSLFDKIVYCGNSSLSASCQIGRAYTAVVSVWYKADKFLGKEYIIDTSGLYEGCVGCPVQSILKKSYTKGATMLTAILFE